MFSSPFRRPPWASVMGLTVLLLLEEFGNARATVPSLIVLWIKKKKSHKDIEIIKKNINGLEKCNSKLL